MPDSLESNGLVPLTAYTQGAHVHDSILSYGPLVSVSEKYWGQIRRTGAGLPLRTGKRNWGSPPKSHVLHWVWGGGHLLLWGMQKFQETHIRAELLGFPKSRSPKTQPCGTKSRVCWRECSHKSLRWRMTSQLNGA